MAEEAADTGHHFGTELSRELTLFHVTMMGVGMMIGAGVFLGVGRSIATVGPGGALLTFALAAWTSVPLIMVRAKRRVESLVNRIV